MLFAAGDESSDFFVIESGAVAIVQGLGKENRVIAVQGQHRFLGELSLLTGQRLYLTGVVRDAGEVIQVPVDKLREIVAEDKALSDLILGAFMARRSILIDVGTGIKLIGSRFSPDSRRLREFLARNRMPHQWIDLEEDEDAEALLDRPRRSSRARPRWWSPGGGEILRNPSNAELGTSDRPRLRRAAAGAVRRRRRRRRARPGSPPRSTRASEGLDVQGVEAVASGGQAGTSARIENYLGFPAGVSGSELAQRAASRRSSSARALTVPAAAVALTSEPGRHEIQLSNGETATGRTRGHRHRRPVPPPRRAAAGGVRGRRRLLRRHPGRGPAVRRRPGRDRRRRELGRPGGDVPLPRMPRNAGC